MAIPDFQTLMLPVLRHLSDGKEHTLRDLVAAMSNEFGLTSEECAQLLPSGTQPLTNNRAGWADASRQRAGLVDPVRRGVARITLRGTEILAKKPTRIDMKFLEQFPEYVAFRAIRREAVTTTGPDEDTTTATPE